MPIATVEVRLDLHHVRERVLVDLRAQWAASCAKSNIRGCFHLTG